MPSRSAVGLSAMPRCARVMHALQSAFKVFLQFGKRNIEGAQAGNHHVIVARHGSYGRQGRECCLQPAPDAIADDGIADLFSDGKAKTRQRSAVGWLWLRPLLRFEYECRRRTARPAADGEEFRAPFQRLERHEITK
jgi:hypothetical protein